MQADALIIASSEKHQLKGPIEVVMSHDVVF